MTLPAPEPTAQAHSDKLLAHIQSVIKANGGKITFEQYMHLALYAPGLGYYSAGLQKFGKAGDFVTAPEISPLFGQCLAHRCMSVFQSLSGKGDILEFGAGSGKLAVDILSKLEQLAQLPAHYYIVEVSADLKQRQQTYIQSTIPHLAKRVIWLDQLPTSAIRGVIIANEVLDAMPVHLCRTAKTGQIEEAYVIWNEAEQKLDWKYVNCHDTELERQVKALSLPEQYTTEINLHISHWINSLSKILTQGLALMIDYGFLAEEYYRPDRHMGTLMCHYQHHAHDNPLILPGLQDITAHVNFTAVGEAAEAAGMTVASFSHQADFLINSGLLELAQEQSQGQDAEIQYSIANQIKQLTLPSEMGELFKVMALSMGALNGITEQT